MFTPLNVVLSKVGHKINIYNNFKMLTNKPLKYDITGLAV